MSCVPTGRVGLAPDVSGFVTREEENLDDRLRRLARSAKRHVLARVHDLRPGCATGGPDASEAAPVHDPVESAAAPAAPPEAAAPSRTLTPLRLHLAAALIVSAQVQRHFLDWLKPAERLKDAGALALMALGWIARAALALPRMAQVLVLAGLGLYLAPWPEAPLADNRPGVAPQALATVPAQPVQTARAASDGWRELKGAIAAYHLESPELDRSAMKYRARRHTSAARQDFLSWHEDGDAERPRNRLSGALAIEHYPQEAARSETLFVDAARRAAMAGLSVEKISDPVLVHNKFGAFEVADATLAGSGGSRACLVYRHVATAAPLQVHGWFCGAAQRPLDRASLACVLDRVDLLGAGSDTQLRAYFASVERSRKPCGTYRATSAPAGWVDANGRIPELKSAIPDGARRL